MTARRVTALLTLLALLLSGCARAIAEADTGRVKVVTTTGILADLARNVAGDRAQVDSLVPEGGDPHSYEISLRDVRTIVYADLAFSNYALLEEHSLIKALDANLRPGVPNISLAEESVKYAAEIIPLVENIALDTIWLGLRVRGTGAAHGADRSSEVVLSATGATGPGRVLGYLTGSFGDADIYFDSADGFDPGDGYADDSTVLPADAHTHMSWVFTEPGVYTLDLAALLDVGRGQRPIDVGSATFTFAVGVNPYEVSPGATVLDGGHADLTVDLDTHELYVYADPHGGGDHAQHAYPATDVVIDVPAKALTQVPVDPAYRFIGHPSETIYQLPQAVLGAHVHGEIDPHLWQNVRNAQAYVKLIRDELTAVDPAGAAEYHRNAENYLRELEALDTYVRQAIGSIPRGNRNLVTTHDAFGYLAAAYDLTVAGFVSPNPALEPSLADRKRLAETIDTLGVPAVFLEPNLVSRSSTLTEVAQDKGLRICRIYGDSFDREVTSYVQMMTANADSLKECLS